MTALPNADQKAAPPDRKPLTEEVRAVEKTAQVGDIVQVSPEKEMFGACMVVVAEVKSWGIQGYVQSAGEDVRTYVRLQYKDIALTGGRAVWVDADLSCKTCMGIGYDSSGQRCESCQP